MKHIQFVRPLILALGALLFASCATQEEYQKAVDLANYYQDQLSDAEAQNAKLNAANEKLRHELSIAQVNALQASASDPGLEARLASFKRKLDELGSSPGGIARFDLDDGGYVYMVRDAILFASGSAEVTESGRKALVEEIAANINSTPHGRVWVRGHTDSDRVIKPDTLQRFPFGNLQLSAARAIEVAAVLTRSGGVPEEQVAVAGFGPFQPLGPNDTADNKALNRRVEIYVAPAE